MRILICGIFFFAVQANARFNVRLNVGGNGEVVNTAETFISGALRSLGDVDIYSDSDTNFCQYSINAVAMRLILIDSTQTGYVVSFLVLKHENIDDIVMARLYASRAIIKYGNIIRGIDSLIRDDGLGSIANYTFGNSSLIMNEVRTCDTHNLRDILEKFVVEFDNDFLKRERSLDRKVKDNTTRAK